MTSTNEIEEKLFLKAKDFLKKSKGLRKNVMEDIFERNMLIFPRDIVVVNYPRTPCVVFNPGAILVNSKVEVYPRLIFDYWKYTSSVGYFELDIEDVLNGSKPERICTRIVLWPRRLYDFLGTEDARAFRFGDRVILLYTAKGYAPYSDIRRDYVGFAELDENRNLVKRDIFRIKFGDVYYDPITNKDSSFLEMRKNDIWMLTRPNLRGLMICWRTLANMEERVMYGETLEPVFGQEEWEHKVGWSTNAVKLSSNEYIIGWHCVHKEDLSYRDGFAVVSDEGELLGVSDYLLGTKGLVEEYGDRAMVIFGDGLIKYDEKLIWVGGVSDYAVGFFSADLDKVLEKVRWVRG